MKLGDFVPHHPNAESTICFDSENKKKSDLLLKDRDNFREGKGAISGRNRLKESYFFEILKKEVISRTKNTPNL